ncbi:MAG: hypothetical protein WC584_04785 [Candidatus Pacearchaeota archaeon]
MAQLLRVQSLGNVKIIELGPHIDGQAKGRTFISSDVKLIKYYAFKCDKLIGLAEKVVKKEMEQTEESTLTNIIGWYKKEDKEWCGYEDIHHKQRINDKMFGSVQLDSQEYNALETLLKLG